MNMKDTLIPLCLLSSASLLTIGCSNREADEPVADSVTDSILSPSRPASSATSGCTMAPGDVASYRWKSTDHASVDGSALGLIPKGLPRTENELVSSFVLTTRVLESERDAHILVARMGEIRTSATDQPRQLETPFLLEVSHDCQLTGFAYLDSAQRAYARLQQGMIYDLAWQDGDGSFQASNTVGSYDASVSTQSAGGHTTTTRTISRYEQWKHGSRPDIELEKSTLTARHDGDGWFQEITLEERLSGDHMDLKRTAHAERIDARPEMLDGVSSDPSDYVWEDLLALDIEIPRPNPVVASRQKAIALQAGVPIEDALASHRERVDSGLNPALAWQPVRNWLEANPEHTGALVSKLKDRTITDGTRAMTYLALGDAQTPEARRALLGIMRDRSAPIIERSRAILALVTRPDVGVPLAETLADYSSRIEDGETYASKSLARQAILALGILASVHHENEQVQDIADSTIVRLLDSVTKPLNRRPIYGAIANMGDPKHLSLVADIATHPNRDMRKAAAHVFRRLDPRDSSDFVAGWLGRETSNQVKRELYDALDSQTYDAKRDPSDAVLTLAIQDLARNPGIATRRSIIRILARASKRRANDTLGIQAALTRSARYEIAQKSGLYIQAAKGLDADALDAIGQDYSAPLDGADSAAGPSDSQTPSGRRVFP